MFPFCYPIVVHIYIQDYVDFVASLFICNRGITADEFINMYMCISIYVSL